MLALKNHFRKDHRTAPKANGLIGLPELYVCSKYGKKNTKPFILTNSKELRGVENFMMSDLEFGVGNCVLASITRMMDYYRNIMNDNNIPLDYKVIYWNAKNGVRTIGIKHGFDPDNKGSWHASLKNLKYNIIDYTVRDVTKIVRTVFDAYGLKGIVKEHWIFKGRYATFHKIIKNEIDSGRPFLMSIAFGYYSAHTLTGVGYQTYTNKSGRQAIHLVQVIDGWSDSYRYIDWKRQGPLVITTIEPVIISFI